MIYKGKGCFRKLSKNLKEELKNINPDEIICNVDRRNRLVTVCISKNDLVYIGTAICSILDEFNEVKGKNRATGRAIKAYKNQRNSEKVRKNLLKFPKGWTIKQALNVISCPFSYKSMVLESRYLTDPLEVEA